MPFPLTAGGHAIPDAKALGYHLLRDALDDRPVAWFSEAARSGGLSDEEVHGVLRALLKRSDATSLGLGAALVRELKPERMGYWLIEALKGDVGVLLTPDRLTDATVEGCLGLAASEVMSLEREGSRALVLRALRSIGASVAEARVLALYGSPDEIAGYGPALRESVDPAVHEALALGRERVPEGDLIVAMLDGS